MELDAMDFFEDEEVRYVVIFVTAAGREDAIAIGRTLVEERLVACVNVLDGMLSIFRWKGKVEEDSECLLIIKTRVERIGDVIARVKEVHKYDVPEIVALPIMDGNSAYLQWIDEVT